MVIDFKVFFSALAAARMVRGCCGCGKLPQGSYPSTAAGGEERRGRRGFRSSPLTSKAVFTGVLIRY